MDIHKISNFVIAVMFAFSLVKTPSVAVAETSQPIPFFDVNANEDKVEARYWAMGDTLTLTITRSNTPDYTTTRTVDGTAPGDASTTFALFDLSGEYDIQTGDQVSVENGSITKTTIVQNPGIDGIDMDADRIRGTAEPNSRVDVLACESVCATRHVTTDANGEWLADFGHPGIKSDEQSTLDIIWGTSLEGERIDADGDRSIFRTIAWGNVLVVNPIRNIVSVYDWAHGKTLTLSIDAPGFVPPAPITVDNGYVNFFLDFDIQAGQKVSVTDGTIAASHAVRDFVITIVDPTHDTISGTTNDTTSQIHLLFLTESQSCNRITQPNSDGTWSVNVAIAGLGEEVCHLKPGSEGEMRQVDINGNSTMEDWTVPDPTITVRIPHEMSSVSLRGWANTPETIFTLTVDDPATPEPVDYRRTGNDTWFDLFDFRLEPGFVVTVTDGTTTRTVVVIDQSITAVDVQNSLVKGSTTSSLPMEVIARCDNIQYVRYLMPTPGMEWTADFSSPGAEPDAQTTVALDYACNVRAVQTYPDGNVSSYVWPYRSGSQADPMNDWVSAEFWPPDTYLELWINSNFIDSIVMPPPDENGISVMLFNLGNYDLKTGDNVSIIAGTYEMSYVVEYLEITTVDLVHDLVYGLAQPNEDVIVFANHNGTWDTYGVRYVTADDFGEWSVDFSQSVPGGPYEEQFTIDITTASGVAADIDGNTEVSWPTQKTRIIDNSGGVIFTPNVNMQIPVDALTSAVEFNIVEGGGGYELSTNLGTATVIFSAAITPHDTVFDPPAIIAFSWKDADSDGFVDNTSLPETDLLLVKDGVVITPVCSANPNCNTTTNKLMIEVSSLSLFALAVPVDSTPPTITWLGNIYDGNSFPFGFVPSEPACTASDDLSGVLGDCTVTGYSSTVGLHTLIATARDCAGNVITETRTYTVLGWTLRGFYQPVDMNGVYNVVKGGSTVPLKFEVFAGSPELMDTTTVKSLTYAETACDANAITDEVEVVATGGTSLRYDTVSGQFIFNWKTPSTAGKCYRVIMITLDDSSLITYFKTK